MSAQKRKIGYYFLYFHEKDDNKIKLELSFDDVESFFSEVMKIQPIKRKLDLPNNKFYYLDSIEISRNAVHGIFKSAKTNHIPPIINSLTLDEKRNPKTLEEGDSEKIHFSLKVDNNEIIFVLEERKVGITYNQFVHYISQMNQVVKKLPLHKKYGIIMLDNFFDEYEKLSRVQVAEIYYDKQILGSEFLNFGQISDEMQESAVFILRAKRSKSIWASLHSSIKNFATGVDSKPKKIRIYGNGEDGNPIRLDTTMMKKKEYIEASLDDNTKIVDSASLLKQLDQLIEEM